MTPLYKDTEDYRTFYITFDQLAFCGESEDLCGRSNGYSRTVCLCCRYGRPLKYSKDTHPINPGLAVYKKIKAAVTGQTSSAYGVALAELSNILELTLSSMVVFLRSSVRRGAAPAMT
jgi:hypothetical protein